jgi:hypothetical protein
LKGDQLFVRTLSMQRIAQTENKRIYMLRVGFKPTTPAFECAKTVYTLDHVATVVGRHIHGVSRIR